MAKVLTEQVRPWPEKIGVGIDPIADDSAALHSLLLHDFPRALNNLQTYSEPSFQFGFSSSHNLGYAGKHNPWWVRADSSIPGGSQKVFLAQMPIVVPWEAKRLFWTADLERGNLDSEVLMTIAPVNIWLYLCSNPFTKPGLGYPPIGATGAAHSHESIVSFVDSDIPKLTGDAPRTQFTSHQFSTGSFGTGTHKLIDDTTIGWENFYGRGWVTLTGDVPMSNLIIAADFNTAAVHDFIMLREFSIWGDYS